MSLGTHRGYSQVEVHKIMPTEQSPRDSQRLELRTEPQAMTTAADKVKRDAIMHKRMGRDLDRMPDHLDFNEDQVTQIKALFDTQQRSPELTRTRLRERILGLLTDEQWAIINERKRPD
ncbi:hypothetical protein G3480_22525 [Thiorhodococcus mannitoliphagus]|uniref:Uncharacterized protein n=1 Tax=Thiorhodococcus mannitoliphagus TaxID=329406 RepID=A0A6P1DZW1_9GAMM|nr:hypothetical protein [Thiorhodococcus mannitoliphagus]NEX23040.1 hypothetical protein [Thiorhodococcus mannitoliphagus]